MMINAHIRDAAALAARTPAEVSTYLRAGGWRLARRTATVAYWIFPVDGDDIEIMQPLDPTLRDYASRVGDVIATLALAETRSELDVLRQISQSTWDVHTVSLFPPNDHAGMIALEDGVAAYEGLRSLVAAAAYTVFGKQQRAVQPPRKPQGMADFLRMVRVGPASEGSFVVTAHTPVPPRLAEHPPLVNNAGGPAEDEPVERQVSLRIHSAARAALDAADAALLSVDGLEPFSEAVHRGVSANLCEALAVLAGTTGHPFQLSVALAAARPVDARIEPVRFRRDHIPVLREAAAEMRARTPEEDITVVGEVVRLYRESGAGSEITVVGRVDDSDTLRRIWMALPATEYDIAMLAHQEMRQVTVRGNLERRGTRYYLTPVSRLRMLPPAEGE
jgi:hypothetical protein